MKNTTFAKLMTAAGEALGHSSTVWTKYPRPQMRRNHFQSLNGTWTIDGQTIRVPFPPESVLSLYEGNATEEYTYEKKFMLSETDLGKITDGCRILLHFGAVDQIADVHLNGSFIGKHFGGYLPFTYDITDCVYTDEENILEVKVTDTLSNLYPYGKQRVDRGGMWYTPISGIWQSVWLECVPVSYIRNLYITPNLTGLHLEVTCITEAITTPVVEIMLHDNRKLCINSFRQKSRHENSSLTVGGTTDDLAHITTYVTDIDLTVLGSSGNTPYEPKLWSPDSPYLYQMTVSYGADTVESYFALRTIEIKAVGDCNRLCLNGSPIYMQGVLDQGYYSDGIFTPADEAEYERDILRMKELGMNMLRKHIKIEPECFYYYCDLHGMLVVQDMVNSGPYSFIRDTALPTVGILRKSDKHTRASKARKEFFISHTAETMETLYNHPCIIAYTIFNEGWGQFESDRIYDFAKSYDPSRVYDSTSGWFIQKKNDFESRHIYFKNQKFPKGTRKKFSHELRRPLFISEFGGCALRVPNHCFNPDKSYGYANDDSVEGLMKSISEVYDRVIFDSIPHGCCGYVYTQVSDVEDEINGFYTYDRKVCKVDIPAFKALTDKVNAAFQKNIML